MFRLLFCLVLLALNSNAFSKTVLVTGSNRGIGLEFVAQYAALGWTVIATSRTPEDDAELHTLAEANPKIQIEQLDVTDPGQISALANKYRGTAIDLLINNAGMSGDRQPQAWGSIDKAAFDGLMAVNVFGPLKVSEAFAEHVAASEEKKIVVISSTAGSIASLTRPTPLPVLAISKTAVNMAMRTVAMRVKDQGIAVGILMPGAVDTRNGFRRTRWLEHSPDAE